MFKNCDIKIGKRYIYVFDKRFSSYMQTKMMNDCEQRFLELVNTIDLTSCSWKRPYYLFETIEEKEEVSGQAYDGMIKCRIRLNHEGEMPMVHEEAHMVLYQNLGQMSYAWSEGFAEYMVAKRSNEIDLLSGKYGDYLKLDYRSNIESIIYSLTHEDREFFNQLRWNNIFYSMSLASIIFYIESELGKDQLKYIESLIRSGLYDKLGNFISKKVIYQWLNWIEHNKIHP